jgi:protocatechuate 3,4-dioxygenase alpha subunit
MTAGLSPSQTIGPYLRLLLREDAARIDARDAVTLFGHVLDGAGDPVPDAMLELWQADAAGRYIGPDDTATPPGFTGFARVATDDDGRYVIETVKPGPVAGQSPHIAVSVFARGLLHRVVTRIYFPDEAAANAADPVLVSVTPEERRTTLVAQPHDGALRFDIRLQGPGETVFFAV